MAKLNIKPKDLLNNLIEGIVIRTFETSVYSGKFMNLYYDSLK